MKNFPKACTCCQKMYSEQEWNQLPPAAGGLRMDLGDGEALEMRNCSCNGTLSIEIKTGEPTQANA